MSAKHLLLVIYDISKNKRRRKLHQVLLDFGTPVQYSAFECLLDAEEIMHMRKVMKRVIRPRVDQVRIYHLCKSCAAKVEVTCGADVLSPDSGTIVV